MKVIGIDNFDRDYISDILIEENLSEREAFDMVSSHNENMRSYDPWYYRAVADDYKLRVFEP